MSAMLDVASSSDIEQSHYNNERIDISLNDEQKYSLDPLDHDKAVQDSLQSNEESLIESVVQGKMNYLTGVQGSSTQLECDAMNQVASGAPEILYWMKDRQVLRLGSRVHQMRNGTLLVQNVTSRDTGIYACVAKRGRERRTTRTQLSVVTLGGNTPPTNSYIRTGSNSDLSRYSYDVAESTSSSNGLVITALEEVSDKVDKAIDATVKKMKSNNASKANVMKAIKYPLKESDRYL